MKNVELQLSDAQFYYLSNLARIELRSIDQLLFVLLHNGMTYNYFEGNECLEILPGDYTAEERLEAGSPTCSFTPRRIAFQHDGFGNLLKFDESAIDINSVIDQDDSRDIDAEVKALKDLNDSIKERIKQKNHKAHSISDS